MNSQRLLKTALWIANAGIALAIVICSILWFVVSKPPDPLADLRTTKVPRRGNTNVGGDHGSNARLAMAGNLSTQFPLQPPPPPVVVPSEPPLSTLYAVSSTMAPNSATVILKARPQISFVARLDEVLKPGVIATAVPEREYLNGWKVVEIRGYPDYSVVLERGGKQETLAKKDTATASAGWVPPPLLVPGQPLAPDLQRYRGQPYNPQGYRSYQRGATWFLDPEEANWAQANVEAVLQNDVRLSPAEGGGVRLDFVRSGSIVEARGLQAGDVVTEINRRRIEGPGQINELMNQLRGENAQQVYIRLNRAGRAIVLVYRPAQ